MNIKILFRILLFVPLMMLLIYASLPSVEYLWLSCDELSLLEVVGYNAVITDSKPVLIVYMVVWLLTSLAMFFYINIARIIYIVVIILGLILLTLVGNRLSAPVENLVMFIMALSIGVILALMYSESTRIFFNKEKAKENKEEADEDEFP